MNSPTFALLAFGLALGCGGFGEPPDIEPDDSAPDAGSTTLPDAASAPVDSDFDGVSDDADNCPAVTNPAQADGDADGYGDDCDCDPLSAEIAADLVLADPLSQDLGNVAPATGFAAASWAFAAAGYEQRRLADNGADAAFFSAAGPLLEVRVEATVASTDVQSFDGDDLRQLFLTARGASSAATFDAVGCGIEIVEALPAAAQTSVIALGGTPITPLVVPASRTERAGVVEGEELSIVLELRGATLRCEVTIRGVTTTATAQNVAPTPGFVGFYTRETAALFRDVRICSFRPSAE